MDDGAPWRGNVIHEDVVPVFDLSDPETLLKSFAIPVSHEMDAASTAGVKLRILASHRKQFSRMYMSCQLQGIP